MLVLSSRPDFADQMRTLFRSTSCLCIAGLFLLATGCARQETATPSPTTWTDDLGRAIELASPVQGVVTLAPSLTELVFAIGAGDRMVGVGEPDDYPPAVEGLPRYSTFPINFEAITALGPDLVLATDQVNNPRDAETFAAVGIPTYFFTLDDLDDVFRATRTLGDMLGEPERAAYVADSLEQVMTDLRAETATLPDKPLVLFLIGDETLFSFGNESYVHDLIDLAGGISATGDVDIANPILDAEFVLTKKPDVILGTFAENYDPQRLLDLYPTWDIVPALQNGRVYSLNPDLIYRPGPRLLAGAQQMVRLLHPERFANATPDTP